MTMQTFAVLLIGLAYGPRLGLATVAVYLAQGLAGLPVFTAGGGISHLFGPTGGYLVGFMFAAYAVGQLARLGWSKPALGVLVAMLAGSALIYLFGFSWLAMAIGAEKAFWGGIMPFLVGDAVKAALAAALLPVAWKAVNRLS
jgi:biotin transport system substrate-specific component